MSRFPRALTFSLLLSGSLFSGVLVSGTLFSGTVLAASQLVPAAAPGAPAEEGRAQALIGELLNNVDWQLLLRIQQNLLANLDLLVPYTEEYISCLEAEGALDKSQPLTLKSLIGSAKSASTNCQVILQSLAGKLNFDITAEELDRGLSPEYRELLKKSL